MWKLTGVLSPITYSFGSGPLDFLRKCPLQTWQSRQYEGHAKSSVTNRFPWFYPRYILKCFTALEWCVE